MKWNSFITCFLTPLKPSIEDSLFKNNEHEIIHGYTEFVGKIYQYLFYNQANYTDIKGCFLPHNMFLNIRLIQDQLSDNITNPSSKYLNSMMASCTNDTIWQIKDWVKENVTHNQYITQLTSFLLYRNISFDEDSNVFIDSHKYHIDGGIAFDASGTHSFSVINNCTAQNITEIVKNYSIKQLNLWKQNAVDLCSIPYINNITTNPLLHGNNLQGSNGYNNTINCLITALEGFASSYIDKITNITAGSIYFGGNWFRYFLMPEANRLGYMFEQESWTYEPRPMLDYIANAPNTLITLPFKCPKDPILIRPLYQYSNNYFDKLLSFFVESDNIQVVNNSLTLYDRQFSVTNNNPFGHYTLSYKGALMFVGFTGDACNKSSLINFLQNWNQKITCLYTPVKLVLQETLFQKEGYELVHGYVRLTDKIYQYFFYNQAEGSKGCFLPHNSFFDIELLQDQLSANITDPSSEYLEEQLLICQYARLTINSFIKNIVHNKQITQFISFLLDSEINVKPDGSTSIDFQRYQIDKHGIFYSGNTPHFFNVGNNCTLDHIKNVIQHYSTEQLNLWLTEAGKICPLLIQNISNNFQSLSNQHTSFINKTNSTYFDCIVTPLEPVIQSNIGNNIIYGFLSFNTNIFRYFLHKLNMTGFMFEEGKNSCDLKQIFLDIINFETLNTISSNCEIQPIKIQSLLNHHFIGEPTQSFLINPSNAHVTSDHSITIYSRLFHVIKNNILLSDDNLTMFWGFIGDACNKNNLTNFVLSYYLKNLYEQYPNINESHLISTDNMTTTDYLDSYCKNKTYDTSILHGNMGFYGTIIPIVCLIGYIVYEIAKCYRPHSYKQVANPETALHNTEINNIYNEDIILQENLIGDRTIEPSIE